MTDRDVHFLDACRGCGGNAQAKVAFRSHLPTGFTRQPNDRYTMLPSHLDGAQNARAVAASRDRKQHIAAARMCGEFTGKYTFVAIVICHCCESLGVCMQRNGP